MLLLLLTLFLVTNLNSKSLNSIYNMNCLLFFIILSEIMLFITVCTAVWFLGTMNASLIVGSVFPITVLFLCYLWISNTMFSFVFFCCLEISTLSSYLLSKGSVIGFTTIRVVSYLIVIHCIHVLITLVWVWLFSYYVSLVEVQRKSYSNVIEYLYIVVWLLQLL
jgi:hypothetical protein